MAAFVEEIFRSLPRADQRHWARTYLRGLLCSPHRTSCRELAAAQSLPETVAQRLHQFINASSWAWEPVRQALTQQICDRTAPTAWAVTELFLPRQGQSTVGVHTTVDTVTGRPVSGQRVLGLFLCTEVGSFPVSWRLLLPDAWLKDRQRRLRARIPPEMTARPRWAHLVEFIGEVTRGQLPELPWIFAVPLTPAEVSGVLGAVADRRLDLLCDITPGQPVRPAHGRAAPVTVRDVFSLRRVRSAPSDRHPPIFATVRVDVRHPSHPEPRAYHAMEWPDPAGGQPVRYLLTNLTPRRAEQMLSRTTGPTRDAAATMGHSFGVRDFLGRSFPGWHHHMTMASTAYAYRHLPADEPETVTQPPVPEVESLCMT